MSDKRRPRTLLEVAKSSPSSSSHRPSPTTPERIELAVAFARAEITSGQAAAALKCATKNPFTTLAICLMTAARRGSIRVEIVK